MKTFTEYNNNPECYPYFYKDGKNVYYVGLLMFDELALH